MVKIEKIYEADLIQVPGAEGLSDDDARTAEGWELFSEATGAAIVRSFSGSVASGRRVIAYIESDNLTDDQIERAKKRIKGID